MLPTDGVRGPKGPRSVKRRGAARSAGFENRIGQRYLERVKRDFDPHGPGSPESD